MRIPRSPADYFSANRAWLPSLRRKDWSMSELDDLDSIYRRLGFNDYEACLEEFESRINDEDGFWQEARRIARTAAEDVILEVKKS